MAGITRIEIVSDWDDWRVRMSKTYAALSNQIYRELFRRLGAPLEDGIETIHCTKEEAMSRYDHQEGIDIILRFLHGGKATMQEKILDWIEDTATFEDMKGNAESGAYHYCTANYYSVFYVLEKGILKFRSGIVLKLPEFRIADGRGLIPWQFNKNKRDGRRATFRYVYFKDIPDDCILWAESSAKNVPAKVA